MAGKDQAKLDRLMAELLAAYQRADKRIGDELQAIGEEERHDSRRRRLRSLQTEVQALRSQLDADARAWVDQKLPQVYELGGATAAADVAGAFTFTQPHRVAIQSLADSTLKSLLRGNAGIEGSVKRLVRASVKEASLDKLLTGRTPVQASAELRGQLARKAVTAITYKNGTKHQIGDYADMVVRSVTAVAYNTGTIVEAKQNGVRYAVCSDGFGCGMTSHSDDLKPDGKLFPLGTALKNSISHPRCRRAWSPLPGVNSRKQADEVERSGAFKRTAEQIEDERQADLTRATRQREKRARQVVRERRIAERKAKSAARKT